MFHGLTINDTQKLVFDYIKEHNITYPDNWNREQIAFGKEWMIGFMRRNNFSLRSPESTSIARSIGFNEHVKLFFDNYKDIMTKYKLLPGMIFNLDETGLMTVLAPPTILAEKGCKQVGQISSAERGILVTACCYISAEGRFLPPAMISLRVNFKDYMTKDAPAGTLGLDCQSGWMNSISFVKTMKHFIKYIGCS